MLNGSSALTEGRASQIKSTLPDVIGISPRTLEQRRVRDCLFRRQFHKSKQRGGDVIEFVRDALR